MTAGPAPDPAPHRPITTPAGALVGRERELAMLRDALAAALAGRGSLVLIGGEAGLGKTTLAEALLGEATRQGATVLVGRCYDLAETPPYGPWAEALDRAPTGDDLPALPAAVLPPAHDAGAPLASQDAILRRVRDYLAALAARRPVALLLEDLHWADAASLDLLRVVARDLRAQPALLLATYRDDELTRRHPLYALLPLLDREARAARLTLRRFDAESVEALVVGRYALSAADAARLVAWLHGRAEGNAFFVTQLLRALEETGALRPAAGGWALGDLGAVGLPTPLRQVLDARLARLDEDSHRLLTLAAVIGQEVPLALWAAVAETDEDGLLDAIDAAGEAHLVAVAPDGSGVRFAHALIREALYDGLVATRRRRVHRRAAEALAAVPGPDPDAVASHLQRAGDARAGEWLMRAGERAQRAYAWLTAADRYEAALPLLEEQGAGPERRVEVLIALAQLRRYKDTGRSVALMEEAARLADATGDAAVAASARFEAGNMRCIAWADPAGLLAMAAELPALEALSPAERARLTAPRILGISPEERYHRGALAQWTADLGRYREAWALAAPFRAGEPGMTARGLIALGWIHAAMGRPAEARRAIAAARTIFRASGQHAQVGWAFAHELQYIVLPYEAERVAERRGLAAEAEGEHARASDVYDDVPPRIASIELLVLEGGWGEVRGLAMRGRASTYVGFRAESASVQARVARWQGDRELAWAAVREFLVAGPAAEPGSTYFLPAMELLQVAAALALDDGDLAAARAWLAAHDRWLAWSGSVRYRAEGAIGWATYHRAMADLALARQHAERALTHAAAPRQPLSLLAAHRLLGELDTAAGRYDDASGRLDAALAIAHACEAPYERALTLLALAELRLAQGEGMGAGQTLDEAHALLEPLEARPALARARAARLAATRPVPAYPAGLSAREAEVLRLVAQGLSNARAAERLFLSPRTIDQHLRSIYGKLGVNSRAAATAFAIDHGLR